MITIRNGIKIPTKLSDCTHLLCEDCGYKKEAIKVTSCSECLESLRYLSQDCNVCAKTAVYDHHLCNHRTNFLRRRERGI